MHVWHGYTMWNSLFMWLFWILVLFIIGLVAFRLISQKKQTDNYDSNQSLTILKERLAKGEINEDEYRRLKRLLEED